MNTIDWEENNNEMNLANSDRFSMKNLQAMQLVARMKEAADQCGAGFVGGFITPTGERFVMSNVDDDDIQNAAINHHLDEMHINKINEIRLLMENFEG